MPIAYFEGRLSASLHMRDSAADPTARLAHAGLARGYRALLASLKADNDRAADVAVAVADSD